MIIDFLLGRRDFRADDGFPPGAEYASSPTANFWYSIAGTGTNSGVNVDHDTALTYSAVWCATLRRIGTLSQLPKNLYRRLDARRREIAIDREEHWLLHQQPNPEMTASQFHLLMEEWRLNGGNAYAEIEWEMSLDDSRRRAVAMWPIHPRCCRAVRDEAGQLWYELKDKNGSIKGYLPPEDVIHLPSLMMKNAFDGIGVVTAARESIGFGISTEQHGAKLVGNGALPPAVVTTPKTMTEDARKSFRKEWKEIHGKGDETVALLTEGADLKALTFDNEDLQYLSIRQHNIEEIARWYDLPPHTLHHLLRMTNNNVEQLSIDIVRFSFLPWIVPNEQEYLRKLIPDPKERRQFYVKYEVNGLLRGDAQSRSTLYHQGLFDGWLSPNEVRELEDWNPYPGGDQYFVQSAMIPIEQAGVEQESTAAPRPDNREQSLKSVARAMLTDALGRAIRRESKAARNAAKTPGQFNNWIDDFYAKHPDTVAELLTLPCEACAVFGHTREPLAWGKILADESRTALLLLTDDATVDTLATAVDSLMESWERDRAATLVRGVAELN